MTRGASTRTAAPTATEQAGPSERRTRLTPTQLPSVERVPTYRMEANVGEVPEDLLEAIVDDAIARLDVERDEILVQRAEAVVWNDGSLGCPEPGTAYTQALVNGYWVVLRAGDRELDYRATDRGFFRLCEHPLPRRPVIPGTDARDAPD